jgi:hypothetical protein
MQVQRTPVFKGLGAELMHVGGQFTFSRSSPRSVEQWGAIKWMGT